MSTARSRRLSFDRSGHKMFVRYASYERFAQSTVVRISTTKLPGLQSDIYYPVPLSRRNCRGACTRRHGKSMSFITPLRRATSLKRFGRVSRSYLSDALLLPVYILQRADRHLN